jgi:hypothetical protein
VKFLDLMSTRPGRAIRVAAGGALIATGASLGGVGGWALAAFGVLPLATGAANVCPISPMFGRPARGGACRTRTAR